MKLHLRRGRLRYGYGMGPVSESGLSTIRRWKSNCAIAAGERKGERKNLTSIYHRSALASEFKFFGQARAHGLNSFAMGVSLGEYARPLDQLSKCRHA